ncbi:DUF5666 domain-containing protein [Streptomyces sp. NPDC013178]|uniref:DUF5666 domain-containing protein n=1 Tax=unclassified Streptomyces TaxID=2593676 RepID=UPI0033FDCE93
MDDPDTVEVLSGPGGEEPRRTSLRALWQRRSARGRAVIAATTVAVLALGGTVAYAATSGGSSDATAGGSPSASASHDGPGDRQGGRGGPWSRLGGEAVHGEATVKDRDTGTWVVRVWQRGTVEKTDGDRVTVRSEDGTSWTWTVDKDTKVFADGDSSSGADALKKGDTVYVAGSRSGDTRTADRVASGTVGDKAPGDRRFGFPGHGPWGRDDRSPSPSGSGATT